MKTNHIAIALLVAVSVLGIRASMQSPANLNRSQLEYYHDKIESGTATSQDVAMYKEKLEEGIKFAKAEIEQERYMLMVSKMPLERLNSAKAQIAALEQEIQDLKNKLAGL